MLQNREYRHDAKRTFGGIISSNYYSTSTKALPDEPQRQVVDGAQGRRWLRRKKGEKVRADKKALYSK